jgi:hypothetical protein
MAKLTAARRAALPASKFAIKVKGGDHKYPIDTRARAANALARVQQFGTSSEKAQVRKAVCAKYDMPSCPDK